MKRLFFMFLALLLCVMVQAQDNVEITLLKFPTLVYRAFLSP